VIIPAETIPEKGFKAEVTIPEDLESEERFRLLAEMEISIVEASFAFLIIMIPKTTIIKPPVRARYEINELPKKDEAPIRIRMKKVISTRACPINIEGPALHPS
jgi:hypothetical protein